MRTKQKGSVFTEYVVVLFFCALGIYFGLVGGDEEDPNQVQPLVDALHDRQGSFIDSVLQP